MQQPGRLCVLRRVKLPEQPGKPGLCRGDLLLYRVKQAVFLLQLTAPLLLPVFLLQQFSVALQLIPGRIELCQYGEQVRHILLPENMTAPNIC